MLSYDYPILGLFWTMLILFLWIAWIILVFRTVVDVFRSDDMGGLAKGLWLLFIVLIPWLGVLIYLIARGDKMRRRDIETAQAQESAMRDYIRQAAGTSSVADELTKLSDLAARGVITQAELEEQKRRLLA